MSKLSKRCDMSNANLNRAPDGEVWNAVMVALLMYLLVWLMFSRTAERGPMRNRQGDVILSREM